MIETKTDKNQNLIAELGTMRLMIVFCPHQQKYMHPMCQKGYKRRSTPQLSVAREWAIDLLERGYCAWRG